MMEVIVLAAGPALYGITRIPAYLRDRKVRKGNEKAGLTWV